jgi:hypothetical protein
VKLICLNSASQWEHEEISKYPELGSFIEKLKTIIIENPGRGLVELLPLEAGEAVESRKQTVNISLFSSRYAIGYNFLSAYYINNGNTIIILRMNYD